MDARLATATGLGLQKIRRKILQIAPLTPIRLLTLHFRQLGKLGEDHPASPAGLQCGILPTLLVAAWC
jgi:hypothetical protein